MESQQEEVIRLTEKYGVDWIEHIEDERNRGKLFTWLFSFIKRSKSKKEIIQIMLDGMEHDEWCQECAISGTSAAMLGILKDEGMEIPDWLKRKHNNGL